MKKILVSILLVTCFSVISRAQTKAVEGVADKRDVRIMFYNVENLFDTYDDPLKRDDEFTPNGQRFWNRKRYYEKLNHIAKVTIALGGWNPPDIIGVCEIENRYVLEGITKYSALKRVGYEIIHKESPDKRGIDVGFLYRPEKFKPINYEAIPIHFPGAPEHKTRDILHVNGILTSGDTVNIFMNHWPSRWGGQLESEGYRTFVASVLRAKVDSIFKTDSSPNILILGDMNDYPENKSLIKILKTQTEYSEPKTKELYSLAWYLQEVKGKGSHKYAGEWGVLDQIIISGDLLNAENGVHTTIDNAHIFNADFLLEPDENYVGYRPNRTYIGFKYHGGYSDHLPVFLDLFFKK